MLEEILACVLQKAFRRGIAHATCHNADGTSETLHKLARQLTEEFTRAFQRTQWGVNGRVEPRYFSDSFVFRGLAGNSASIRCISHTNRRLDGTCIFCFGCLSYEAIQM